ncbi:MAG TPA: peptide chain release factor N(5)-glutamine methyltransferase [Pyrinomonadaceae bacterium]|nr:peptide chain release factor N(5)-glutamine methyltransferase [Pyrinomonadaceae bacterium]
MSEPHSLTVVEALGEAAETLRAAGVAESRREAGSLLAHVTGLDRTRLLTHPEDRLAPESLTEFRRAVARRAAGEPLQYVTGRQDFYGLEFEVTPDVLIPRPETELLVEAALELLREAPAPLVCDVGTGSGCIAVALLVARPGARAVALDISPAALAVAARNAARHGVAPRLTPLVSDCFEALGAGPEIRFDIIVSNPPYVAERDLAGLQREVREHEPRVALTPGGDGLSVIRRLVAESPRLLVPGGHLLFEIGFDQHERVRSLVDPSVWSLLDIHRDLQGIPRTVALRLAG